jgi:hypothetical protein
MVTVPPLPPSTNTLAAIDRVVEKGFQDLATVLTATPSLRAKFFADPTRAIGKNLPPGKYWDYGDNYKWRSWFKRYRWRRTVRARIAERILFTIADEIRENKLSATVNTDAVFEDFFAPIVRVSQRSFTSAFWLSWAAFVAGLTLIGFGIYVAIEPPASGNSTVVSTVFGGSGAISALGAVYAMATQGIREAALDHARLRAVLTGFATQLGQLRAIAEQPAAERSKPFDVNTVGKINDAITKAMQAALTMIPSPVQAAAAIPKDRQALRPKQTRTVNPKQKRSTKPQQPGP